MLAFDADGCACGNAVKLMSSRGGSVEEHLAAAGRLIERLLVLLMAGKDGVAAGWCGIHGQSPSDRRPPLTQAI